MWGKPVRGVLMTLVVVLLSACKLVVTVPAGGSVESRRGFQCVGGASCTIDIKHADFADEYFARPNPGYEFAGWRSGPRRVCAGSESACALSAGPFAALPGFDDILASNAEFILEPVFNELKPDRFSRQAWAALIAETTSNQFNSDDFLYRLVPGVANCDPGVLSRAAQQRFTDALNLVRRLHDLPPVQHDDFFSAESQQAALIQMANRYLTHEPRTTDTCYSHAADMGAGSSNLFAGSVQRDPVSFLISWINDGANVYDKASAGHRRWALYPWLAYTTYGQVRGYSAMKVFGFGQSLQSAPPAGLEFVAFPYREYPYVLLKRQTPTPWSLSMVPASRWSDFDYFAYASVQVSETDSGARLNVHSLYRDTRSVGLRNFLSWRVDGWQYDTDYTVRVSNVRLPGGGLTRVEYPVRIEYDSLVSPSR